MSRDLLPTFIGIGVAKTGSTSLKAYLNQHPDIFIPKIREPSHFALDQQKRFQKGAGTIEEYLSLFEGGRTSQHRGEISPAYFESDEACENIAAVIPEVKIVVCIRQPVERAYSHYLMHLRSRVLPYDDFEMAMSMCSESKDLTKNDSNWFYISSFYHDRIKQYVDAFGSANVHVIKYDDYEKDTSGTLSRVFEFLGVSNDIEIDFSKKERVGRGKPRSRLLKKAVNSTGFCKKLFQAIVPVVIRDRLRLMVYYMNHQPKKGLSKKEKLRISELYRKDILATEALTGLDLKDWLA